ncbi:hypothetical protein D3C86_1287740 [compost metagenome]
MTTLTSTANWRNGKRAGRDSCGCQGQSGFGLPGRRQERRGLPLCLEGQGCPSPARSARLCCFRRGTGRSAGHPDDGRQEQDAGPDAYVVRVGRLAEAAREGRHGRQHEEELEAVREGDPEPLRAAAHRPVRPGNDHSATHQTVAGQELARSPAAGRHGQAGAVVAADLRRR